MGAGILPTTIHKGKLYFLFGKEGNKKNLRLDFQTLEVELTIVNHILRPLSEKLEKS